MMTGLDYDQIRGAINDALLVPDRKRELLQIFDDVLTECSKFRALHRQLGSCGTAGAGAAAPDSPTEAQTRAVEDLIGSAVVRLRLTAGRRPEMVDRIAALEGDLGMERNRSELLRDDIEGVHKWLDERGALRNGVGDRLSIVGRIMRLLKAKHQHSKQTKT